MMSVLTLLLAALFFSAWKAPNWVRETGSAALVFGILCFFLGMWQFLDTVQEFEENISQGVLCGGVKVAMIPAMYGLIIYLISLVIRVFQKPRI